MARDGRCIVEEGVAPLSLLARPAFAHAQKTHENGRGSGCPLPLPNPGSATADRIFRFNLNVPVELGSVS